jgi:putative protease
MIRDGRDIDTLVKAILAEDGIQQESAPHHQQLIDIELETVPEAGDILRIHAPQNGNLR